MKALLAIAISLAAVQPVERFDLRVVAQPSTTGDYTHYRDFAAQEWRTDVPEVENHPVIMDLGGQSLRLALYCGGAFSDGRETFPHPVRWAYVQYDPWRFTGETWVPGEASIDDIIGELMKTYTVTDIMDAMDRHTAPPEEGAPLE